jgi:membrane-associated protease RseP (regulator of RpoE activity)
MTMKLTKRVAFLCILGAISSCVTRVGGFQAPSPAVQSSSRRLHQSNNKFLTSRPPQKDATTTTTSLSALPAGMSALSSPLGSVGVLAFVVLFHEAGHYLAARSLGIKVEEFSVGIGPKLFGFQAFGNEFNLRGLPLGGYVRFPENYNSTLVAELQEEAMNRQISQEKQDRSTENQARSGLMNALTFGRLERKRAQQKDAKQMAEKEEESKKWWNGIFANANKPQKEEKTSIEKLEIEYYDDPDLLQNRSWPQRALVLSGGVIFNMLLAFLILFGQINLGSGLPKPVFDQGAVVASIPRQESPSNGILSPGDVIIKVNGSPLSMTSSPNSAAAQKAIADFIGTIRQTPDGDSLNLQVLKPNAKTPVDVVVQPKRTGGIDGGPQSIGVMLRPNFQTTIAIKTKSVPKAAQLAASSVAELTQETTNGLLAFFSTIASGKGAPPGQSVSGPIGLIRTGSSVVSTSDVAAILTFMAAISVNLAVVNSLPLPALDGGQMIFVISEALTGRKVDQRLQEGITSVALVFLLLLSFSTTIGDVENIFRGRQ